MLKIKKLLLKNYAGYKEATFDFVREDGSFKPLAAFYGPNGCGKSSCLDAINLLGQAKQYIGRSSDLLFRKMTYHIDYDPTLPHFAEYAETMRIEGTFDFNGAEKVVIVTSSGVERNDLEGFGNIVYINADHPMNMKKFQIPGERIDLFLEIANEVYGYKSSVGKPVQTYEKGWDGSEASYSDYDSKPEGESYVFYQDMILNKEEEGVKVHFKSMSDGERKIATVLRNLCDPVVIDRSDIILIDNTEMHVYMERHAPMIAKILSCFPTKQFIITTHSPILVGMNSPAMGIVVPSFIGDRYGQDCLFNVPKIKAAYAKTQVISG
jgi:predicted ATPase